MPRLTLLGTRPPASYVPSIPCSGANSAVSRSPSARPRASMVRSPSLVVPAACVTSPIRRPSTPSPPARMTSAPTLICERTDWPEMMGATAKTMRSVAATTARIVRCTSPNLADVESTDAAVNAPLAGCVLRYAPDGLPVGPRAAKNLSEGRDEGLYFGRHGGHHGGGGGQARPARRT